MPETTIEQALRQFIVDDPAISALIGTRFYSMTVPQKAQTPYGRYQRVSSPRVSSHDGPTGLAHPRFQIDWVTTSEAVSVDAYGKVVEIAIVARRVLDGFRGMMNTVRVHLIALEDERDLFDSDSKLTGRSQDYVIWHQEEVTTWL